MIECRYKCKCLQDEARVNVQPRYEGQDVVEWVERVIGAAIAKDHRARSPWCKSDTMEYVKIPAPKNVPYLGAKPKLDS